MKASGPRCWGSYPEGDRKPLNDFKKGVASVVSYYEDSGGTTEDY